MRVVLARAVFTRSVLILCARAIALPSDALIAARSPPATSEIPTALTFVSLNITVLHGALRGILSVAGWAGLGRLPVRRGHVLGGLPSAAVVGLGCIFASEIKRRRPYNRIYNFSTDSGCRDRVLLVLGSNMTKQAALTALLDPNTHFRPPLTHTSHHRPALVDLSRSIAVSGVSHSRFRRFSTCISAVYGVSLVGVSLLSADVAVTVVWPEVISQRVLIPRGRTSAHWKALAKAHTIVQQPRIRRKITYAVIWASTLEIMAPNMLVHHL
jgi:hypothetical protein